jgi:hypothetical protein
MSTTETLSEAAVSLFRLYIERKGHIAADYSREKIDVSSYCLLNIELTPIPI